MSAAGTRLIPLAELEQRDLGAWRELSERAVAPNPYWDPDFVLPAAEGLDEGGDVALLCVLDGDGWAACLPVRRNQRWHRIPLPSVTSWLHLYCFMGTPLVAPGREAEALPELVRALPSAGTAAAFTALDWVESEGAIAEALTGADAPANLIFERFSRPALHRRPQPDYLEGRIKSKHRQEFRRKARGLERELDGQLELVDRSAEPDAIEALLELEAAGWKGREGTALRSNPAHEQFVRRMTRAFAERGALELVCLECAGQVVAASSALLAGDGAFGFKVGYDETYRRYSPGVELSLRYLERFHERTELAWVDSCTAPGNELYNRLWPDSRELFSPAYPASGALGLVARPALRSAIAVRDRDRD